MKKYFVTADIHGFYDPLMEGLRQAGFQRDNPDHILIVCGDIFDRGRHPLEVYRFLRSLPLERRFLIRGNHEYLLRDLVERGFPLDIDYHNGTFDTLLHFQPDFLTRYVSDLQTCSKSGHHGESGKPYLVDTDDLYKNKISNEVVSWIFSDEWRNYLELGKYVFVHSFVPKNDIYDQAWRDASDKMWEKATWGCPWELYSLGYFHLEEKEGKVLVCGHWHTSDIYNNLLYRYEKEKRLPRDYNPIFKSDFCPGLIGLDACTVLTNVVNVLVINEDELGME